MERLFKPEWSGLKRLMFLKAASGGSLNEYEIIGNPVAFQTNLARPLSGFTIPFLPIQSGTGDPSPENVRPISGWTGLTAWQMENNVLSLDRTRGYLSGYAPDNKRDFSYDRYYFGLTSNNYNDTSYQSTFTIEENGRKVTTKSANSVYGVAFPVPVESGETYYISANVADDLGTGAPRYSFYTQDGTWISGDAIPLANRRAELEIIAPANAATLCIIFTSPSNTERTYSDVFVATSEISSYPVTFPATGKNLLPKGESKTNTDIVFTVQDNGEVVATGTASQTRFWGVRFTLPAGSYILNGCPSGGGQNTYSIDIRNAVGGTGISGISGDTGNGSAFTLTEPLTAFVNIRIANGYACPQDGLKISPMIRLASISDASYEPFTNTVYGGTLYAVNGVVTVEYGIVDLGTGIWGVNSTGDQEFMFSNVIKDSVERPAASSTKINLICSNLETVSAYSIYTGTSKQGIGIHIDGAIRAVYPNMPTDGTQFKQAVNGWMLAYPLATPYEIQLDPITIQTLIGDNTIWTDTNGENTVKYLKKG